MLREGIVSTPAPSAPWYADGLRFACTQCGNCCSGAPGYVWVNSEEIEQMATFLSLTPAEFNKRHVRRVGRGRSLLEHRNGDCEFLDRHSDGKTTCRIHSVRPVQCRTWPFWSSNLVSPQAWREASRGCPGMDTGAHYPLPVIQAALTENGTRPL